MVSEAHRRAQNRYYRKNREKINATALQRYHAHEDKSFLYRNNIKRKYRITTEQVDNMRLKQNNCCAVCFRSSDKALQIDHNHVTGQVRGLLCGDCNVAEGRISRTGLSLTEFCENLSQYLEHGNL